MLEQLLQIVKDAAVYMQRRNFDIEQKGNSSNFATSADLAVEQFLRQKLCALLPGSAMLGEENGSEDLSRKYLWVVDPIDGTSNFIRDLGLSVISVALLENGVPELGAVYHPYRDEMYYAQRGKGAFCNGRPIRVSDRDFAHGHLCSAMSLYEKKYAPPCFEIIRRVYDQCDDLRRLGAAALELSCLAAGKVELYFEIRLFPWDVAAAALLIQEAGGYVEFMFHKQLPLTTPFGVIAANSKESFEKLRKIVYTHIPEKLY